MLLLLALHANFKFILWLNMRGQEELCGILNGIIAGSPELIFKLEILFFPELFILNQVKPF